MSTPFISSLWQNVHNLKDKDCGQILGEDARAVIVLFLGKLGKQLGSIMVTHVCTDTKDHNNPVTCSQIGSCWAWCLDQNNLVQNIDQAAGKWCYLSNYEDQNYVQKEHCKTNQQCEIYTKCISPCESGCNKFSIEKQIDKLYQQVRAQKTKEQL